jgi:Protein of unknown function (DUF3810)
MSTAGLKRFARGRILIVAVAACAALVPVSPKTVDRFYSAGLYTRLQPLLTSMSNLAPVALFDLLVAGVIAVWLALAWRDVRGAGSLSRAAFRVGIRAVTWAAVGYLAFLAGWGLNYRRVPLVEALPFDASRVTSDAARRAAGLAVERLNALNRDAHAAGWPAADAIDSDLVTGIHRAVADLRRGAAIVPARPKRTALDAYFRRAGVDGMTDPIFLETLVASDVLPFERPFVVAHEWSHLAGFADEGDANFVGWLACMRSSIAAQYSGWLFLYSQLAQSIGARDAAPIGERLADGPRADLRAIRDRFVRHVNPRVAAAGWRAYDAYLRANRIEAGTNSYALVVRLALGARLPSGAPLLP